MKKKMLYWFGALALVAANAAFAVAPAAAASEAMTVKQCGCVYGGGPGGPEGPGTAVCTEFFQPGCEKVEEDCPPCGVQ